jgi:hypothetical protein
VGADLGARYEELIRAWADHDLVRIQLLHSPDVVLEIDGRHRFAGRYTGIGAVLAALVKFAPYVMAASPVPDSLEIDGDTVETTSKVTIRSHPDEERVTVFRTTLRFDDAGQIVYVHNRADDQDALDAFFGLIDAERETDPR